MSWLYGGYNDDYNGPILTGKDEWITKAGFEVVPVGDHGILRDRREQLGMTQQQTADAAGITLRQYQRFESGERSMSGASFRIGLSICDALKLDPHRFVMPVKGS